MFIFLIILVTITIIIASRNNLLTSTQDEIILSNNKKNNEYDASINYLMKQDESLENVKNDTLNKIKLIEERAEFDKLGVLETDKAKEDGFTYEGFENLNESSNKRITLKLFYSSKCSYSHAFMPIWFQLKDSISDKTINFEEYECSTNASLCSKENIKSVPTVIINIESSENENHKIEGARSLKNIKDELKHYGVLFNNTNDTNDDDNKTIEGYQNYITASQIEADERKTDDPDCPFISFYEAEKNYYCADSRTMRGCINATKGSGIAPFDAAYGLVGGYLNSLPNPTQSNMNKCSKKHKEMIRRMGLCNIKNLIEKSNYGSDVSSNKAKDRFLKVDYDDNKKITNALSIACSS